MEIKVLSDHRLGCVGVGVREGVEEFVKNHSPCERVTLQNLGGTPCWESPTLEEEGAAETRCEEVTAGRVGRFVFISHDPALIFD